MSKKVLPIQGVLIPDLTFIFTYIKLFRSSADMLLQIEKEDNPKASSGHLKYRTMRRIDGWLYGDGEPISKHDMKKAMRLFCKSFDWEKNNYKITLSDYRNLGYWGWLKGSFLPYRNSTDFEALWPLCDYVFTLCEEEKSYIAKLRKEPGVVSFISIIRQRLHIDTSVCETAQEYLLLVENEEEHYDVTKKNSEFFGALVIHQHLLLASILEQYYYTYYRFDDPKWMDERKVVRRFLPSIKGNKFVGSTSKLIAKIFKESKFKTKEDFYEGLANAVFIEPESIERKITRWSTGESPVNPKEFNSLFKSVMEVPSEIIIACSISDSLSRDLMNQGISAEWIVTEFSKYSKYQSEVIKACS